MNDEADRLSKNDSYKARGQRRGGVLGNYADKEPGPRNDVGGGISAIYKNLPETPGTYLMKNAAGEIIYIGKAGNLKRRVSSYFLRPHDYRIEQLIQNIHSIETRQTDSALEALILEADLIKKHQPVYNVREKDDKSFLYLVITREKFPRVLLARGKDINGTGHIAEYGPFTSASNLKNALKILRKIFPWSTHSPDEIGTLERECLNCQIGLCPGTCVGLIDRDKYLKNIDNLKLFFQGEKKKIIRKLEKEMAAASKNLEFEEAEKIKRQIFALQHIRDTTFLGNGDSEPQIGDAAPKIRIEGYDISNISGDSAVGSMVVFENANPNKSEYRKFKIRMVGEPNDVGMLREVLERRFSRANEPGSWPMPDLILIDGGAAQVNVARNVIQKLGFSIPVVGLAKGPKRKNNLLIGRVPSGIKPATLIRVRDEAHRFAMAYHKKLRGSRFLE